MAPSKWDALESPPAGEDAQTNRTTEVMGALLSRRYQGKRFLRGVHPKDHGCVEATFTVSPELPPQYQVGVFRKPGDSFRSAIRFSNASALVTADCLPAMGPDGKPVVGPDGQPVRTHGSRGMAIKLYDVPGSRLVPEDRERSQDFLMINQPFFAFANVEDYLALNEIILKNNEIPNEFFLRMRSPDPKVAGRARTTFGIIQAIQSGSANAPFQAPPMSPFDNTYFGAAPFGFGEGRVMRFAAKPVNPMTGPVGAAVNDENYLRDSLRKRMAEAAGKDICFDFQIQVRDASQLTNLENDIEDACKAWPDPFVTVARITIPSQALIEQEFCETLFYTPWHGLDEHRPLGGINRMRRDVYTKSAELRGCPFSPNLPPSGRGRRDADPRAEAQRQADAAAGGGFRSRRS
ncbi:MAG TPA: hypothetical protein VF782_03320 [Allosphingosinicella sp.]|jgi:hypothetical protein